MIFDSFAALMEMDGHGGYVWAAYGITMTALALNLYWPRRVRQKYIEAEKQIISRNEARHA